MLASYLWQMQVRLGPEHLAAQGNLVVLASMQGAPATVGSSRNIRSAEKGCRMQDAVACKGLQHEAAASQREAAECYVL